MVNVTTHNGLTLLEFDVQGSKLGSDRDASDVLSEAFSVQASVIVIPVKRFDPAFFDLRSGLAGGFFQKLQNYHCRLVMLGISPHMWQGARHSAILSARPTASATTCSCPIGRRCWRACESAPVDLIAGRTMLRSC